MRKILKVTLLALVTLLLSLSANSKNVYASNIRDIDVKTVDDITTTNLIASDYGNRFDTIYSFTGETISLEGDEDICTHIKEIETQELNIDPLELAKQRAEEAARKKAEEEKRKAQEAIEAAIEAAIERWLEENCGECY